MSEDIYYDNCLLYDLLEDYFLNIHEGILVFNSETGFEEIVIEQKQHKFLTQYSLLNQRTLHILATITLQSLLEYKSL